MATQGSGFQKPKAGRWTAEELAQIAPADDLHVAPFREDGVTYGTPTWVWCVVVGEAVYARAYHGPRSSWYQAAVRQGAGRVHVAGMVREVVFQPVPAEDPLQKAIDAAYREKYGGSPYLEPMVSPRARAATVRILPREEA
ncbi:MULTISPECIES: DUF2255 family protein [unclassified Meiothermus]|uniref:DUF2255 family protein n=1 Tax=unclassified Meiothermus TaxID=370471 RepID=UPI000D7C0A98|nr:MULTISPECIES: DUF2255 family protein [unclassified Meiothermus]PZA06782.1 DUF2255 domain-containing protein [Meiothermus sp. Pnk-1]RYM33660.1 DUF2255 family protein [Meiothermus sp. PNK-Is4]